MCIYYTDDHYVDEDAVTFSAYGGSWFFGNQVGTVCRNLKDSSSYTASDVASRCRHPKLIKYYTDMHDVDEDVRTGVRQGGSWGWENMAGITERSLNAPTFYVDTVVASMCRHLKYSSIIRISIMSTKT